MGWFFVPGRPGKILLGLALTLIAGWFGLGSIAPRSCQDPGTTEAVATAHRLHLQLEKKRAEYADDGMAPTQFADFIERSDLPTDGVRLEGWNDDETELVADKVTSKFLKLYWKKDATLAKYEIRDGVVQFSVRAVFNPGGIHNEHCHAPGECQNVGASP